MKKNEIYKFGANNKTQIKYIEPLVKLYIKFDMVNERDSIGDLVLDAHYVLARLLKKYKKEHGKLVNSYNERFFFKFFLSHIPSIIKPHSNNAKARKLRTLKLKEFKKFVWEARSINHIIEQTGVPY